MPSLTFFSVPCSPTFHTCFKLHYWSSVKFSVICAQPNSKHTWHPKRISTRQLVHFEFPPICLLSSKPLMSTHSYSYEDLFSHTKLLLFLPRILPLVKTEEMPTRRNRGCHRGGTLRLPRVSKEGHKTFKLTWEVEHKPTLFVTHSLTVAFINN